MGGMDAHDLFSQLFGGGGGGFFGGGPSRPSGPRKGKDLVHRVHVTLEELYRGKNVLVVAHGTIIRFILSGIAERALDSIPNGTLSLVRLEGTEWTVEMIANERVENTVRTASREQNPRFVVEHRNLVPGADPSVDATAPTTDR